MRVLNGAANSEIQAGRRGTTGTAGRPRAAPAEVGTGNIVRSFASTSGSPDTDVGVWSASRRPYTSRSSASAGMLTCGTASSGGAASERGQFAMLAVSPEVSR